MWSSSGMDVPNQLTLTDVFGAVISKLSCAPCMAHLGDCGLLLEQLADFRSDHTKTCFGDCLHILVQHLLQLWYCVTQCSGVLFCHDDRQAKDVRTSYLQGQQ